MIADLKPYSEYKDSGLPWLGTIPKHWKLVPNRALMNRRKELVGSKHSEYQLLSLTKQGIIVRDISTGKGKFSSDMGTSQIVRKGDIVFCLFDIPETPRTVGLSQHFGMITGAYTVFEFVDSKKAQYFELFYKAMDDRKSLSPLYSGLRNTIPAPRLLGTKSPQPPPDEQEAIVRFLDWASAKIERAIRAKRKVIALLNEQKQAIIHKAVTRGLDPSVKLKPSGIPWLGDIPEHWQVLNLGYIIKLLTGFPFPSSGFTESSEGVRLLRGINVSTNGIRWDQTVHWMRGQGDGLDNFQLKAGDIVLGMDRPIISSGVRVAKIRDDDTPSLLLQRVARLRTTVKLSPEYLILLLQGRSFYQYMAPIFSGISVPHLSPDQIRKFKIGLPPRHEQDSIVAKISANTADLDHAIERLSKEISLIGELKTSLVVDVVTGKFDVRGKPAHNDEPHSEAEFRLKNEKVDEYEEMLEGQSQ